MPDGDVHTHWSLLHVGVLDGAGLVHVTGDAFGELVGILVTQTGSGGVDLQLLLEGGVCIVVGVIGAVHHDL